MNCLNDAPPAPPGWVRSSFEKNTARYHHRRSKTAVTLRWRQFPPYNLFPNAFYNFLIKFVDITKR